MGVVLKRFVILAVICVCGCRANARRADGRGLNRFEFATQTMGRPVRLVMFVGDRKDAENARTAVFNRISEVEARLDARNPRSEVTRLSESAGGPWFAASEDLFNILRRALQLAERSDGEYDVSAGAAVALWDDAAASGKLPTDHEIAASKALIGWRMLQLNPIDRTARLLLPGMILDLDTLDIAYAIDAGLLTLRRAGVARAMIESESAGIAVAIGAPPGQPGWKTLTTFPNQKGRPSEVFLTNDGVAWTTDRAKSSTIGGYRYDGLIDVDTALPKPPPQPRVMVIAPSASTAAGIRQGVLMLGTAAGPFVRANAPARVSFAQPDAVH